MNDQRDGQGTGYLKNGVLSDADRPCALSLVYLLSLDSG
jgi:hypothetical protein